MSGLFGTASPNHLWILFRPNRKVACHGMLPASKASRLQNTGRWPWTRQEIAVQEKNDPNDVVVYIVSFWVTGSSTVSKMFSGSLCSLSSFAWVACSCYKPFCSSRKLAGRAAPEKEKMKFGSPHGGEVWRVFQIELRTLDGVGVAG
ncbi:hypothetical protein QG37_05790 [Candidozyma auris]|nr:hypothetical protein QG37_05790 [[Candida] auris]